MCNGKLVWKFCSWIILPLVIRILNIVLWPSTLLLSFLGNLRSDRHKWAALIYKYDKIITWVIAFPSCFSLVLCRRATSVKVCMMRKYVKWSKGRNPADRLTSSFIFILHPTSNTAYHSIRVSQLFLSSQFLMVSSCGYPKKCVCVWVRRQGGWTCSV